METASVSQVKNGLSAYLRKVRAGETVLIYDRDEPVAKLTKFEFVDEPDAAMKQAIKDGFITAPKQLLDPSKIRPVKTSGASVLEALLEERRDGR